MKIMKTFLASMIVLSSMSFASENMTPEELKNIGSDKEYYLDEMNHFTKEYKSLIGTVEDGLFMLEDFEGFKEDKLMIFKYSLEDNLFFQSLRKENLNWETIKDPFLNNFKSEQFNKFCNSNLHVLLYDFDVNLQIDYIMKSSGESFIYFDINKNSCTDQLGSSNPNNLDYNDLDKITNDDLGMFN